MMRVGEEEEVECIGVMEKKKRTVEDEHNRKWAAHASSTNMHD